MWPGSGAGGALALLEGDLIMLIAVMEWDSIDEPTVLVGTDRADLLREIARIAGAHYVHLAEHGISPLTADELDDQATVAAWLDALHEASCIPWWTLYATRQCVPTRGAIDAFAIAWNDIRPIPYVLT